SDTHEAEQLAALLVAMAKSVLRESQWKVAIAPRHRSEQFVMMRAIHRFEVVAIAFAEPRIENPMIERSIPCGVLESLAIRFGELLKYFSALQEILTEVRCA